MELAIDITDGRGLSNEAQISSSFKRASHFGRQVPGLKEAESPQLYMHGH